MNDVYRNKIFSIQKNLFPLKNSTMNNKIKNNTNNIFNIDKDKDNSLNKLTEHIQNKQGIKKIKQNNFKRNLEIDIQNKEKEIYYTNNKNKNNFPFTPLIKNTNINDKIEKEKHKEKNMCTQTQTQMAECK